MPEPTPPLDLDALEALVQAHHLPDACSECDHYDDTASFVLPALVARVRALEAEVARLQPRPTPGQTCYICGQCPVVARDAENFWFCARHAVPDCTPL